jgi:sphingosine kinase
MASADPFSDHAAVDDHERADRPAAIPHDTERELIASATLALGRNATLTLGTDSLILLDEGLYGSSRDRCCGLLSEGAFV